MAPQPAERLRKDEEVTAALVMVSQLRALFLQLPHLGTPRERTELEEFRGYRFTRGPLAGARVPVVRTGFREAWRTGDHEAILDVGQRIPDAILQADLDIQTYYVMTRLRLAEPWADRKATETRKR